MLQSFSSNMELRVHFVAADAETVLSTVLNVSGQPEAVAVVGMVAETGVASLFYSFGAVDYFVKVSDGEDAAGTAGYDRNCNFDFPLPIKIKNAAGTASSSLNVVTLSAGTSDIGILYLVNTQKLVP